MPTRTIRRLFDSHVELDTAVAHLYEVIVVGAGPAGSAAAYHLARSGVDVLLVDRAKFPRDKACGDAVMPPALTELALMGLADEMAQRFTPVSQIGIWQPDRPGLDQPIGASTAGYVAPRADLDALLCERALSSGAAWLDQMTVLETRSCGTHALVRGSYGSRPAELRGQLVVAADGSGSRLAQRLRADLEKQPQTSQALTAPKDDRARFTAMRGYYRGLDGPGDMLEFYFREDATSYYWIFPAGQGIANVGVIATMRQLREDRVHLANALATFLEDLPPKGRGARAQLQEQHRAAPIWAGLRGTALFGERLLCAGDAAALVHPRSAEGISAALWSGRMAAETAVSALKHGHLSPPSLSRFGALLRQRYQLTYDEILGA